MSKIFEKEEIHFSLRAKFLTMTRGRASCPRLNRKLRFRLETIRVCFLRRSEFAYESILLITAPSATPPPLHKGNGGTAFCHCGLDPQSKTQKQNHAPATGAWFHICELKIIQSNMKILSSFLAVITILLLLTSCNPTIVQPSGYTARELLTAITAELGATPPTRGVFAHGAQQGNREYLNARLSGLLYYGQAGAKIHEFDLLADYAIHLSTDQSGFEIHVFKLMCISDRAQVSKILQRRIYLLQSREVHIFNPSGYETHIASATVHISGNFVVLLVTNDNQTAIRVIERKT